MRSFVALDGIARTRITIGAAQVEVVLIEEREHVVG